LQKGGKINYSGEHGGIGWTMDQELLWDLVKSAEPGIKVLQFSDGQTGHRRLDRIHHKGIIKWLVIPLVILGFYHDYHLHLPVERNRKYINLILCMNKLRIWWWNAAR
jgi:hypothetical protein